MMQAAEQGAAQVADAAEDGGREGLQPGSWPTLYWVWW